MRTIAAQKVAVALDRAEVSIDRAMADVAALAAILPEARQRAELSATVGQRAFEGLSECLSSLTQARARMVETHRRLDALNQALGSPASAVGPANKLEEECLVEPVPEESRWAV